MSKLFAIGPVEMHEETLEIGGKQVPYFRNEEFSQLVFSASAGLNRLLFNEKGELILLTCSGTGAMEATIMNCFTKEDNLIVIDGGSFGDRFAQICDTHEIPFKVVKVKQGETLTRDMIDELIADEKFTGLLVNLNETSIGQLYDIKMLSKLCKEKDLIFVVDAISAFLADEVNMSKYGIDAVVLSSQKALALAPGLSILALSEKMLNRVSKIDPKSIYFDFKDYLKNAERGQTPFTPAVRIIIELEDMVKRLEEKGIENIIKETNEIALYFRRRIKEIGLDYPSYPLSNAVTPVIFKDENAEEVYRELIDKYGFTVNPSGGENAKKMFRVAHVGKHSIEDTEELVLAIEEIINNKK
ncbi:pyridoxal-phosphate-dependent aminotransferase family protein [Methanobrevibacter olleyae]|uniref:Aminotransferase class V family n=1 Tax=Methanobrevibacter olleyae TaxID=294671 RepID=A0A126R2C3_METOL|nr:aminotransferase class V-fold PLP-dependent enzyme [Methanobrevibacter olleyae]AMK16194.1 aminotransferase class V family [Methanobrevibacter olleyae]SFL53011.1 aspartate aminotransferase [Methanobrevibacter olleyae]